MAHTVLYTHSQSGRRPLTAFAAVFIAGMTGFGLWKDAPWYAMVPIWFAVIGISWILIVNRQSGVQLTHEGLRFHHGKLDRAVPLSEIAHIERHIWSDGPDDIALILKNGERLPIPSDCINSRNFVEALGKAGMQVVSA